jgi:hypothetical protein
MSGPVRMRKDDKHIMVYACVIVRAKSWYS